MALTQISTKGIKDGTITNADINASAAIAGSKISPDFGSQNITTTGSLGSGDITVTGTNPEIFFTDSNNNSDFRIKLESGIFAIQDTTNSNADRFQIASDGTVDVNGNLDVGAGLDVTGNITATGSIPATHIDISGVTTSAARDIIFSTGGSGTGIGVAVDSTSGKFSYNPGENRLFVDNINMPDSGVLNIGSGTGTAGDLQLFHDGNNSFINEVGTGGLFVRCQNTFNLQKAGTSDFMIKATTDGAVELYDSNSLKLTTLSHGIKVVGDLNLTAELNMTEGSDAQRFFDAAVGTSALTFRGTSSGDANHQEMARFFRNGACELNHSGTKTFETHADGVNIVGNEIILQGQSNRKIKYRPGDNDVLYEGEADHFYRQNLNDNRHEFFVGNQNKFQVKSNGAETLGVYNVTSDISIGGEVNIMQGTTNSNRFIDASLADNQALFIRATKDGDANHENMALFHRNLGVNLYFDANEKFKTITNGINVTGGVYVGTTSATGLGSQTGASNVSTYNQSGITLTQYGVTAGFYYDRLNFTNSQYFFVNSSGTGVYLGNGSTSFTAHSDERLKENIIELDGTKAYNHIKTARAASFKWKATGYPTDTKIGFIAQDWETNYPEVTNTTSETIDEVENPKGIQYTETIPVLMAALKQAISKIETLETKVAALEA
jgi:hypothetical protein|tara:strand:+ start:31 stop:2028 length:1998 start_codon:yes stop_codon:yes gene_type:complete